MSNSLNRVQPVFVKTVSALTSIATVLSLSGAAYLAPLAAVAAVPSDYGLTEGNTISASNTNDPDVYIVNALGYKRLFLNPVIFSFYGHLGGFANVKSVSAAARDAFPTSGLFRNCETNAQQVWAVEVTGEDVATFHKVTMSGDQAVAEDANFFKKVFCINNNEQNWYTKSSVDYTSLSQVPVYSRVPGATPIPTGPLSASLAFDNPAAGTVLETQSLADFAHFNVSGSEVVTTVELQRLGVSGDTTVSDVYLFVNGARVSDAGNVSSGKVTFSNGGGLFTAPAVVSVRATIADSTSGQNIGFALTKLNSTVVSVSGNLFTIATDPATLATFTVGSATGPGNFDPQLDVNVWQSTLNISNENVWLKRLTIREIGSIDNTDVRNLRLFVDGIQVSSTQSLSTDGYATFLVNTKMLTGNRIVKVVADVVGGSGRSMQFSLRGYYDIDVTSDGYGVGIKSTSTFPISPTASTIGSASVTVIKSSDSPSGDIVDGATDVVLGRFTLTAFGESIKIETLSFRASVSDAGIDSLKNGRVMINGVQYGSTTTLTTSGDLTDASTSYTVNYTLQPGVATTVEVRADLDEVAADGTTDVGANDIVSVLMEGGDNNNGTGVSSAAQVDVPTATVESNNQTIKAGTMTLAKYSSYTNQSIVTPASSLKLGDYVLTGGSAEDVNINTVNIGLTETGLWAVSALSNVLIKVTNSTGGLVLQTSPKSTVSSTASSSYSVNFTLPKNSTYHVEVWGATSAVTSGTMGTTMDISGTSAQSAATVNATIAIGQVLTAATGSVTSAVSGAMPVNKIVAGLTTTTAAAFDFTATSDVFTVYELVITASSAATSAISNVIVKDGGNIVASAPLNGTSVTFTGLNIMVPNNDTKTLTIDLQLGNIGIGGASTAANAKLTLDSFKARDSVGTITSDTTDRVGNRVYVHKSYPSVAVAALPTSVLSGGEVTASKFNLTANGNTVGIKEIKWDLTRDSATTDIASTSADGKIYIDNQDVTSLGTIAYTGLADASTNLTGTVKFTFTNEYQISSGASKVVELHLQVTVGTTGSVNSQLKLGTSTTAAPNTYTVATAAGGKMIWSDRSGNGTTVHSESTPDWMNDYLLLNSISQSLNK